MNGNRVAWLSPDDPPDAFPDVSAALQEPDGLLAAGGDLCSERLLYAYRHGIFPWFDDGQPILWWSPNPRCVMRVSDFHTSTRMRRKMRTSTASISFNTAFGDVIRHCAGPRRSAQGTWITDNMIAAYEALHEQGWAHSIEVREDDRLVGGMYGLAIDRLFFGESMYSGEPNASKLALLGLCEVLSRNQVETIDCQVVSGHLIRLGATTMPRTEFADLLRRVCCSQTRLQSWPDSPVAVRDLTPR